MGKLGEVRKWLKARQGTGASFKHLPDGVPGIQDLVQDLTVSAYDWATGSCRDPMSVGDLARKALDEILAIIKSHKGNLRFFWAVVDEQSMVPKEKAATQKERQMGKDNVERPEYPEGSCLTPEGVWNYATGKMEPMVSMEVIMNTRPMRKQLWAILAREILDNAKKFPKEVVFIFDYERGSNNLLGVAAQEPVRFLGERIEGEADLQCAYAAARVNACRKVTLYQEDKDKKIIARNIYTVPHVGRPIIYRTSDTDAIPIFLWLLACWENGVGINTSKVYWNYPTRIGAQRTLVRSSYVDMSHLCNTLLGTNDNNRKGEAIDIEVLIFCCALYGNDFIERRVFCNFVSFDLLLWAMRMPLAVKRIHKIGDPDEGFEAFEYLIAHLNECILHYRKAVRGRKAELCTADGHILLPHQGGLGNRDLSLCPYIPDGVETKTTYEAVRKEVYRCKHGSKGRAVANCAKCIKQDTPTDDRPYGTRRHRMPTLGELVGHYTTIKFIVSYWRSDWAGYMEKFKKACQDRSVADTVMLATPATRAGTNKLLVSLYKEKARLVASRDKERSLNPEEFDRIHLARQVNDPDHLHQEVKEDNRLTLNPSVDDPPEDRWARPHSDWVETGSLLVIGAKWAPDWLVKSSLDKWAIGTCSKGWQIEKLITVGSGSLVKAVREWAHEHDIEHVRLRAEKLGKENIRMALNARDSTAVKMATHLLVFPYGDRPGTVRLSVEASYKNKDILVVDAQGQPYLFPEYAAWYDDQHKRQGAAPLPAREIDLEIEDEEKYTQMNLNELLEETERFVGKIESKREKKTRRPPSPVDEFEKQVRQELDQDVRTPPQVDDDSEWDDEEDEEQDAFVERMMRKKKKV